MRSCRASHGIARPLNCGVRRRQTMATFPRTTVALLGTYLVAWTVCFAAMFLLRGETVPWDLYLSYLLLAWTLRGGEIPTLIWISSLVIFIPLAAVLVRLIGRRPPPQKTFRCARCSTVEAHSARTIEAWRAGKTKLFCGSCHAKWLQSQPRVSRASRPSSAGCLGVLLVALVVPALVLGAFYYARLA
jgi:hypothetical protein